MSKHKSPSASPGLHRDERAGGAMTTSPSTEIAELDAGAPIEDPARDSSGQRDGVHTRRSGVAGKHRSKT
jgi:hypothetical protein